MNTKAAKTGTGCMGAIVGSGMGAVMIVVGLLLSLTGIGAIVGLPLMLVGIASPFLGGFMGVVAPAGECPYCQYQIAGILKPGFDCPSCGQRIMVRAGKFLKVSDHGAK